MLKIKARNLHERVFTLHERRISMKILHNEWNNLRTHVIVWLCFILYETLILGIYSGRFLYFADYAIHYIHCIALFYCHTHLVLVSVLRKKLLPRWTLPIAVGIEIIVYFMVLFVIDSIAARFPLIFGMDNVSFDKSYFLRYLWRALYFIGFSTGYYFLITFLEEKERSMKLEKQRLHQIIEQQKVEQELSKAQNAYLRAQINPHFLFNTLNFIYNKTRKLAPTAADAILTLSAMMRYAIESSEEKGYILIQEEIEQVHNLIHLHRMRQNQQIYFEIDVENTVENIRLIPLVLITLVENIFKHGNISLMHHPASLRIGVLDQCLFIKTDNLVNAIHNNTGLNKGLDNVDKRLKNSYGDDVIFSYRIDNKNHFKTEVRVKLNALNIFFLPPTASDKAGK